MSQRRCAASRLASRFPPRAAAGWQSRWPPPAPVFDSCAPHARDPQRDAASEKAGTAPRRTCAIAVLFFPLSLSPRRQPARARPAGQARRRPPAGRRGRRRGASWLAGERTFTQRDHNNLSPFFFPSHALAPLPLIPITSVSNTRSALGGILGGDPIAPYANEGGHLSLRFSPTHAPSRPWSQHLMTWLGIEGVGGGDGGD